MVRDPTAPPSGSETPAAAHRPHPGNPADSPGRASVPDDSRGSPAPSTMPEVGEPYYIDGNGLVHLLT